VVSEEISFICYADASSLKLDVRNSKQKLNKEVQQVKTRQSVRWKLETKSLGAEVRIRSQAPRK
jgi:hypothetical protein